MVAINEMNFMDYIGKIKAGNEEARDQYQVRRRGLDGQKAFARPTISWLSRLRSTPASRSANGKTKTERSAC